MKKITSAGGIIIRYNPHKQILLTIYTHITGLGFPKGICDKASMLESRTKPWPINIVKPFYT